MSKLRFNGVKLCDHQPLSDIARGGERDWLTQLRVTEFITSSDAARKTHFTVPTSILLKSSWNWCWSNYLLPRDERYTLNVWFTRDADLRLSFSFFVSWSQTLFWYIALSLSLISACHWNHLLCLYFFCWKKSIQILPLPAPLPPLWKQEADMAHRVFTSLGHAGTRTLNSQHSTKLEPDYMWRVPPCPYSYSISSEKLQVKTRKQNSQPWSCECTMNSCWAIPWQQIS